MSVGLVSATGWVFVIRVDDEEPIVVEDSQYVQDYVRGTKIRKPKARIVIEIKAAA